MIREPISSDEGGTQCLVQSGNSLNIYCLRGELGSGGLSAPCPRVSGQPPLSSCEPPIGWTRSSTHSLCTFLALKKSHLVLPRCVRAGRRSRGSCGRCPPQQPWETLHHEQTLIKRIKKMKSFGNTDFKVILEKSRLDFSLTYLRAVS